MKQDDLNQLATKQDIENAFNRLNSIIQSKLNPLKEFFTPKEFASKTSMKYSTVIYKCSTARLKAYQDSPNGNWLIHSSELDRFIKQADANTSGEDLNGDLVKA